MDGGSDINLLGPRLVPDNPHWKTREFEFWECFSGDRYSGRDE